MSSSKGGQSSVEIDPQLTAASRDALDYAATAIRMPYSPNRGMTVAAFTPQQRNAFEGANVAAGAFGMPSRDVNLPRAQTNSDGIRGYSSGDLYDQNLRRSLSSGMRESIDNLYADPDTGMMSSDMSNLYASFYGEGKPTPGSGTDGALPTASNPNGASTALPAPAPLVPTTPQYGGQDNDNGDRGGA